MFPCGDDVVYLLCFDIPVHGGTVDVSKERTKNFFRYEVIEPIKTIDLISPIGERSTPQSFTLILIDLSARGALVEVKDVESFIMDCSSVSNSRVICELRQFCLCL